MINKRGVILAFLVILLVSFTSPLVSAEPPFQQEAGELEGLTLRFPPVDSLKLGRNVTSNMHVYNSTNGLILSNTTVDCFLDLYNTTGGHLITNSKMEFDLDEVDFKKEILGGNFSIIGRHSFIIWCNSSTAGGFVSGGFEVTPSGNPPPTSGQGFIYLGSIVAMILITLLFFFISLNMKSESLKFGFIGLSLIGSIIIILYSAVSLQQLLAGFTRITSSFSTFLYLSLFILVILFLFVLLAVTIEALNNFKKRKGLKE